MFFSIRKRLFFVCFASLFSKRVLLLLCLTYSRKILKTKKLNNKYLIRIRAYLLENISHEFKAILWTTDTVWNDEFKLILYGIILNVKCVHVFVCIYLHAMHTICAANDALEKEEGKRRQNAANIFALIRIEVNESAKRRCSKLTPDDFQTHTPARPLARAFSQSLFTVSLIFSHVQPPRSFSVVYLRVRLLRLFFVLQNSIHMHNNIQMFGKK